MKLGIASDHRGTQAAKLLADRLRSAGNQVVLSGSTSGDPCDYPEPAFQVCAAIQRGELERGILICGTGIGMCMAANKMKGIRAASVHDELTAEMARSHNNANVLCVSADLLGQRLIEKIADIWLATAFDGGRHERRIRKIAAIEEGKDPASVA